jgi:hypothetical protein
MSRQSSHIYLLATPLSKVLQTGLALLMAVGLAGASATALADKLNTSDAPQVAMAEEDGNAEVK